MNTIYPHQPGKYHLFLYMLHNTKIRPTINLNMKLTQTSIKQSTQKQKDTNNAIKT